jgi:ubiquinone/menaquinone biosynthesis C-methylase UbiE
MSTHPYTHGHHESVLRSHEWRTAANSAAFLLASLKPDDRILDVGCGPGNITADLASYVPRGTIEGVDVSPDVVARAAERYAGEPDNVSFRVDDVYRLEAADETYDVVYVHQVLQHLHDPVTALVEIRRVLREGGLVAARDADFGGFIWYPDAPELDRWLDLYFRVTERNQAEANGGRHVPSWIRAAGFDDLRVTSSTWTFQTPAERHWWGGLWADRVTQSDFARQAIEYSLSDAGELELMATAFRRWADDDDAVFVVPSVEVIARR